MSDAINAKVAELVMGIVWDDKRCRECGWPIVPDQQPGCWASNCSMRPPPERRADAHAPYSTDPAADYAVLVRVRETWTVDQQVAFAVALMKQCASRTPYPDNWSAFENVTENQPCDYSTAALAALGAK